MKERKPTKLEVHEQQVRELWIKVAVAVAASSNSTASSSMITWADNAVKKFDERFHPDRQ